MSLEGMYHLVVSCCVEFVWRLAGMWCDASVKAKSEEFFEDADILNSVHRSMRNDMVSSFSFYT